MGKVESLVEDLEAAEGNIRSVNPWYPDLETYFNENMGLADNGNDKQRLINLNNWINHVGIQYLFRSGNSDRSPSRRSVQRLHVQVPLQSRGCQVDAELQLSERDGRLRGAHITNSGTQTPFIRITK